MNLLEVKLEKAECAGMFQDAKKIPICTFQ